MQMVECERYEEDEQPWRVTCSFEALALMDFHAHLSSDTEIIGFLGGVWDAQRKTLRVQRALPARRLPSADAGVEVELDPACVPEIVDALERDRQRVVGWYHSHPTFATTPSLRDCENQANYQSLFAEEMDDDQGEKRLETFSRKRKRVTVARVPFVGAIVGPYRGPRGDPDPDPDPDPVAEMTWFHVDADAGDGVLRDAGLAGQPKEVHVERRILSKTTTAFSIGCVATRSRWRTSSVPAPSGSTAWTCRSRGDPDPDRSRLTKLGIQVMSGEPATRLTKIFAACGPGFETRRRRRRRTRFVDAIAEKTKRAWRATLSHDT